MKFFLMLAIAWACIIAAYYKGEDDGKRAAFATTQTSCVLAIKMSVDEVCKNPKTICNKNRK